jgi:hypothetical protein
MNVFARHFFAAARVIAVWAALASPLFAGVQDYEFQLVQIAVGRIAIAHRRPRDVAGWSMVRAAWAISCKAATVNKARAISFTHDEIKAHSQRIKDIAPEKR